MQCNYCTSAIHCERHSLRNVEHSTLKQMQTSFHYIFCSQRRYNVNFASFECAQLILQFDIINSLSYAEVHELQQLHNRIASKKSI